MRYSTILGKTLRKVPRGVNSKSYSLLFQGGFIRSLGRGLFAFLPLGIRVLEKIKGIIREELNELGGQEVLVPMVSPFSLWERGGRLELIHKDMVRFQDRLGKDYVLSPTHEETMVELVRLCIHSYRDLPVFLYQFQNTFRDEERVRCGLVRAREFTMNDGYSFHRSYAELNNFFPKIFKTYQNIFSRCGVEVYPAEAGVGYIRGEKSFEFLLPSQLGDDVLIYCENCGYAANREVAVGVKDYTQGMPKEMEKKKTLGCTSMDALSKCLGFPKRGLTKSMVYRGRGGLIMAVVRGDYAVSVEKLSRATGQQISGLAESEQLDKMGLYSGYMSPLGLRKDVTIVVDDAVANSPNLTYGANEKGYHFINVNFARDYEVDHVADIAQVKRDNRCIQCGGVLTEERAMELGHIFKLGKFYSRQLHLFFQEDDGTQVIPQMGTYGIGLGRLLSAIVDKNHDEQGICWPRGLAPFKAFLMGIGKSFAVRDWVNSIHAENKDDILMDDRSESPGVKFRDAELIGIPLRIVVSSRYLKENKVEFHDRNTGNTWFVDINKVQEELNKLQ